MTNAERGRSIADVLAQARAGLHRVGPADLPAHQAAGAVVVDIRPLTNRELEGHLPGSVVVDRLVLEWRLDPHSPDRMADGPSYDDEIIVVCNEGFSSSLAARDLQAMGFRRATDLAGGFRGWVAGGGAVVEQPDQQVT